MLEFKKEDPIGYQHTAALFTNDTTLEPQSALLCEPATKWTDIVSCLCAFLVIMTIFFFLLVTKYKYCLLIYMFHDAPWLEGTSMGNLGMENDDI